jgi:hypothetical protein
MQISTGQYEIESSETILSESFTNNKRKWEIVDIETERAEVRDGYYWMHNTTKSRWNYYKTKAPLKKHDDFIIEANIEIEKKEEASGHVGLVWGFDKERKYLNRFTLSADGKRALVMHFEKDHHRIIHRFQNRNLPKINLQEPIRFTIVKLGEYFHFFINTHKIYQAHETLFCANGFFMGYYIEPGLSMKSNLFEVRKMKGRDLDVTRGFSQLMDTKY